MIVENHPCPKCGYDHIHLLSTTNEWKYYCQKCDVRFNENGVSLPPGGGLRGDGSVSGSTPLVLALNDGFALPYIRSDIRIGWTLQMSRPIRGFPSFSEGLEAFRNNRSIPLHEYRTVTLECAEDVAIAMSGIRPCTCHPSEAPVPCQRKYALSECRAAAGILEDGIPAAVTDHSSYELGVTAERERCALVADFHEENAIYGDWDGPSTARTIAAQIRSGK